MRREWIEMDAVRHADALGMVSLHAEGVDRNIRYCRSCVTCWKSPSMRREWIEI